MVTPIGLAMLPSCMITGIAFPVGSWLGITALICVTPATLPGALTADWNIAGCPPMTTVTPSAGCGDDPAGVTTPSTPPGEVWPVPVAYNVIVVPAFAGLLAPLRVPSWLKATACPWPEVL